MAMSAEGKVSGRTFLCVLLKVAPPSRTPASTTASGELGEWRPRGHAWGPFHLQTRDPKLFCKID